MKLAENDCLTKFNYSVKFHCIRANLRVRVFSIPNPNSNLGVNRGVRVWMKELFNALIFFVETYILVKQIFSASFMEIG